MLQVLEQGAGGVYGLVAPAAVAVTPDGTTVYVGSASGAGIARFDAVSRTVLDYRPVARSPAPAIRALALDGTRLDALTDRALLVHQTRSEGPLGLPSSVPFTGALDLVTVSKGRRVVLAPDRLILVGPDGGELSALPLDRGRRLASTGDSVFALTDAALSRVVVRDGVLEATGSVAVAGGDHVGASVDGAVATVARVCHHDVLLFDTTGDVPTLSATLTPPGTIPECPQPGRHVEYGPVVDYEIRLWRDLSAYAFPAAALPIGGVVVTAPLHGAGLADWSVTDPSKSPSIYRSTGDRLPGLQWQIGRHDAFGPFPPLVDARGLADLAYAGGRIFVTSRLGESLQITDVQSGERQLLQRGMFGGIDGLSGAYTLRLSPDGQNVYVAGRTDDHIGVFRVLESGLLQRGTPAALERDTALATDAPRPGGVVRVAVSPDGSLVVASDLSSASLHVLIRDQTDGELTWRARVPLMDCDGRPPLATDVVFSPDGRQLYATDFQFEGESCLQHYDVVSGGLIHRERTKDAAIAGVESLDVSPDGRFVYATAYRGRALVALPRDLLTGALGRPIATPDDALYGAEFVAFTKDRRFAYVGNPVDGKLVSLAHDPETGVATVIEVTESSDEEPLRGAAGVKLSPDDRFVIVAVRQESRIAVYERDAAGRLEPFGHASGPELAFVNDLALSADGNRLYAASSHAGTLSVWAVRPCPR